MATPEAKKDYESTLDSYLSSLGEKDRKATLFIPIEAGANKEPLAYLKKQAEALGYDFRTADVAKPGHFGEQILPEDAKHLRIERPSKILGGYISDTSGVLMAKYERLGLESTLDSELHTGMTQAVVSFIKDTVQKLGREGSADNILGDGDLKFAVVARPHIAASIMYESPTEDNSIKEILYKITGDIESEKKQEIVEWDNTVDETHPLINYLNGKLQEITSDKRYSGERDLDSFKYEQARRNDKTLQILEKRSAGKPIVLYLENLEQLDETNAAALEHIIRSAPKSKIFIVGSYEVDKLGLEEELGNDNLREIRDEHQDKIQYLPLYSPEGFEKDLQNKFKDAPESAAQFLAIAAAAKSAADSEVLSKAAETLGIDGKTIMNCMSYLIENKLLKDLKPANSKIAKKALESYKDQPEFYKTIAEAIEFVYKGRAKQFSPLLAELYESAKDEAKVIDWAKVAAEQFTDTSNFESAIRKYQQVLDLLKDKSAQLETLEKKLDVESAHGNSNLLEEDGEKAYNLAKELQDKRLQAKALLVWGKAIKDKYRNDSAFPKLDEAIILLTELNQKNGLAEAHYHRAGSFTHIGKNSEATRELEKAEYFARETNSKKMLGNVLNQRGLIYKSEKNYAEAEKTFLAAKETFEEIKDFADVGKILNNLASLHMNTKNFKKAIEIGEEGFRKLSEVNYLLPVPALLQTLGAAYEELGNSLKAKETFVRADEYATRIGNTKIAAFAKYSQGVYSGGKERGKFFEETAEILQKHPLKSNEAAPLTKSVEEEVTEDIKRWLAFAKNLNCEEKIKAIIEDLSKNN